MFLPVCYPRQHVNFLAGADIENPFLSLTGNEITQSFDEESSDKLNNAHQSCGKSVEDTKKVEMSLFVMTNDVKQMLVYFIVCGGCTQLFFQISKKPAPETEASQGDGKVVKTNFQTQFSSGDTGPG